MRGADRLAEAMAEAGIDVVFSLSGNQIMPLYDALIAPGIRIVHTRHEGAAVFMADAYGQLTGRVGIALVTAAPGFGNALGALYTAAMQETPVILLSGDSPVGLDGSAPFQEFPQAAAAGPLVKASMRPQTADDLAPMFAEAVRLALTGRPGPVHISLPFDVLNAEAAAPGALDFAPTVKSPPADAIADIAGRLAKAKKPLILTGPQLSRSRAAETVAALETAFDCPVVDMESPRGLRDPALGAFAEVLREADAVLYLGKPVDFTTGFAKPPALAAETVMVTDPDAAQRERAARLLGNRLAVCVDADTPACAQALIAAARPAATEAGWRAAVRDAVTYRSRPQGISGLTADRVADAIQSEVDAANDCVFICDGGEFGQWVQGFVNAPVRLINGTSGVIGGCLPYALAATIARPGATVIVAMGDGTAGFHFAEFETAARENTGFVAVIGNDARWNAEYAIQMREYGADRTIGCELSEAARYDRAAEAFGCDAAFATTADEVAVALEKAVASGRPTCVEARIAPVPAPQFSRTGTAAPGAH